MLQVNRWKQIWIPVVFCLGFTALVSAAQPNRITRPIDVTRSRVITGNVRRQAQPQFDRGEVDPAMRLDYAVLIYKPSAAQQTDLESLLTDQQNPSSPRYRQWRQPEEFADRFGLSLSDHSKVVAWLNSQGLHVERSARGRNWVAFSGTAAQVSVALHTSIHRFEINGESHFAIATDPSVPEALADVTGGFLGLDDFKLKSQAIRVSPEYNSGTSHFLVPEDYATIYDIAPLYKAGIDGTGQSIAVIGDSDVALSDLRAFRTRYNLPPNDPKLVPYSSTDPGSGDQLEADLDLEWSGAIAPNATIYYVYGPSAFTALILAIDLNLAPVISSSFGACEVEVPVGPYRSLAQQANAQGITILNASGDSGAAACDPQGFFQFATQGQAVLWPAVLPEVTAVGGTQFVEGSGTYWATTNSPNFGSALSYIPEAAWNETNVTGLGSTGGGASAYYPRPSWQNGPGVPSDSARHVPDIALSAAGHDAYEVNYSGTIVGIGGTSASTPSMAGIIALLNHYQVSKGFQKQAGLGNINPQLYRLAQSAPSAFHDVTSGSNVVPCLQGSQDCLTGSYGYSAGTAYDMTTGLGSIDVNNFVTLWNTQTQAVTVVLSLGATRVGPNDTVALTAGVYPVSGNGMPTGTVSFSFGSGGVALGSANLVTRNGQQVADLYFPAYLLQGTGTLLLTAEYSGDVAFSSGGTSRSIQVVPPAGAAAIIATWPDTVLPNPPDAKGLSWTTTITLREAAGVAARVTGFFIDGAAQPLSQYFPSPEIAPVSTNSYTVVLRNLAAPTTRTFLINGVDAAGQTWSRQFGVTYNPPAPGVNFVITPTPLVITQNTAADASCQWPVHVTIDELGGFPLAITGLFQGSVDISAKASAIFGTERLYPYGSLQGTICYGGITPPATDSIAVILSNAIFSNVAVSFTGAPQNPATITATPATVKLSAADATKPASASLAVNISDKTQQWTASIFPTSRTTSWLTLSQYSGTGPGQISLSASGTGFEPGVYRATVVLQSQNAIPQWINVPVMFVLGNSTSPTSIAAVVNAASSSPIGSPGALMAIYGSNLSSITRTLGTTFSSGGVSVSVNGIAAEMTYISPGQINIEIPFEVGTGAGMIGVNNNGQIAAYQIDIQPAAPAIFTDDNGFLSSQTTVAPGGTATMYISGAGEVSPALPDGFLPGPNALGAFKPVLPLTVTVGGVAAFLKTTGIAPLQIGTMRVDFTVPPSVPPGDQPVIVTVNGVASAPAKVTVQSGQ